VERLTDGDAGREEDGREGEAGEPQGQPVRARGGATALLTAFGGRERHWR
jgi:hypothetical protein